MDQVSIIDDVRNRRILAVINAAMKAMPDDLFLSESEGFGILTCTDVSEAITILAQLERQQVIDWEQNSRTQAFIVRLGLHFFTKLSQDCGAAGIEHELKNAQEIDDPFLRDRLVSRLLHLVS